MEDYRKNCLEEVNWRHPKTTAGKICLVNARSRIQDTGSTIHETSCAKDPQNLSSATPKPDWECSNACKQEQDPKCASLQPAGSEERRDPTRRQDRSALESSVSV